MCLRLIAVAVILATTGLAGCVSYEALLKSDAEDCQLLGHYPGGNDYAFCMKALNKRRCEDRSSRDPMCQYAGAK